MGDNSNMIVGTSASGSDGTGLAWFGAQGTTAPTDGDSALAAGFNNAGLITEAGLTISLALTTKKIKAYGSQTAQRTIVTDEETTFKIAMLETNPISTAVYFKKPLSTFTPDGDGAWSTTSGTYAQTFYAAVMDVVDGSGADIRRLRAYCPKLEVTNNDDLTIGNGNEMPWGVTCTAYPVAGVAIQWFFIVPNLAS